MCLSKILDKNYDIKKQTRVNLINLSGISIKIKKNNYTIW